MNTLTPKILLIKTHVTDEDFYFDEVKLTLDTTYSLRVGYIKVPKSELRIITHLFENDIDEDDFYYYIPFIQLLRDDVVIEYYDQQSTFANLFRLFLEKYPELESICRSTQYFRKCE